MLIGVSTVQKQTNKLLTEIAKGYIVTTIQKGNYTNASESKAAGTGELLLHEVTEPGACLFLEHEPTPVQERVLADVDRAVAEALFDHDRRTVQQTLFLAEATVQQRRTRKRQDRQHKQNLQTW